MSKHQSCDCKYFMQYVDVLLVFLVQIWFFVRFIFSTHAFAMMGLEMKLN